MVKILEIQDYQSKYPILINVSQISRVEKIGVENHTVTKITLICGAWFLTDDSIRTIKARMDEK